MVKQGHHPRGGGTFVDVNSREELDIVEEAFEDAEMEEMDDKGTDASGRRTAENSEVDNGKEGAVRVQEATKGNDAIVGSSGNTNEEHGKKLNNKGIGNDEDTTKNGISGGGTSLGRALATATRSQNTNEESESDDREVQTFRFEFTTKGEFDPRIAVKEAVSMVCSVDDAARFMPWNGIGKGFVGVERRPKTKKAIERMFNLESIMRGEKGKKGLVVVGVKVKTSVTFAKLKAALRHQLEETNVFLRQHKFEDEMLVELVGWIGFVILSVVRMEVLANRLRKLWQEHLDKTGGGELPKFETVVTNVYGKGGVAVKMLGIRTKSTEATRLTTIALEADACSRMHGVFIPAVTGSKKVRINDLAERQKRLEGNLTVVMIRGLHPNVLHATMPKQKTEDEEVTVYEWMMNATCTISVDGEMQEVPLIHGVESTDKSEEEGIIKVIYKKMLFQEVNNFIDNQAKAAWKATSTYQGLQCQSRYGCEPGRINESNKRNSASMSVKAKSNMLNENLRKAALVVESASNDSYRHYKKPGKVVFKWGDQDEAEIDEEQDAGNTRQRNGATGRHGQGAATDGGYGATSESRDNGNHAGSGRQLLTIESHENDMKALRASMKEEFEQQLKEMSKEMTEQSERAKRSNEAAEQRHRDEIEKANEERQALREENQKLKEDVESTIASEVESRVETKVRATMNEVKELKVRNQSRDEEIKELRDLFANLQATVAKGQGGERPPTQIGNSSTRRASPESSITMSRTSSSLAGNPTTGSIEEERMKQGIAAAKQAMMSDEATQSTSEETRTMESETLKRRKVATPTKQDDSPEIKPRAQRARTGASPESMEVERGNGDDVMKRLESCATSPPRINHRASTENDAGKKKSGGGNATRNPKSPWQSTVQQTLGLPSTPDRAVARIDLAEEAEKNGWLDGSESAEQAHSNWRAKKMQRAPGTPVRGVNLTRAMDEASGQKSVPSPKTKKQGNSVRPVRNNTGKTSLQEALTAKGPAGPRTNE